MSDLPQVEESKEKQPTSYIAELYGCAPAVYKNPETRLSAARKCPFRKKHCDVTSNRNRVALLNLGYEGVASDAKAITTAYGKEALPLGICSCWTKRQNEDIARPWILCPKRLLALDPPNPIIPKEVRDLIEIDNDSRVGVWPELKFRRLDKAPGSKRFFEYTFDYLLMSLDANGEPAGAPYIIEVMTSSTRGGGLSEHMTDVLLGRPQRHLSKYVQSVYTPNYRQVFERMLGQFVAKSEIAEAWGGKAIWVFQDVLLDYIEQTTAFDSTKLAPSQKGNVFAEVYSLVSPPPGESEHIAGLHLAHHKSLRGRARLTEHTSDYTSFLGLGFAPDISELRKTLREGIKRAKKKKGSGNWFEFVWDEVKDPRQTEPVVSSKLK